MAFEFVDCDGDLQIKLKDSDIICCTLKNKAFHFLVSENLFILDGSKIGLYKMNEQFKCEKVKYNIDSNYSSCIYMPGINYFCELGVSASKICKLIYDGKECHKKFVKKIKCNDVDTTNDYLIYDKDNKIILYNPINDSHMTLMNKDAEAIYVCLRKNILMIRKADVTNFVTLPDCKPLPYKLGKVIEIENISNDIFRTSEEAFYYDEEKLIKLDDDTICQYIPYTESMWKKYREALSQHLLPDIISKLILPFL